MIETSGMVDDDNDDGVDVSGLRTNSIVVGLGEQAVGE